MAQATVRADLPEPLDVERHLAAKVALDLVGAVDDLASRLTCSSVRSRTRVSGLTLAWARIFWLVGRPMP